MLHFIIKLTGVLLRRTSSMDDTSAWASPRHVGSSYDLPSSRNTTLRPSYYFLLDFSLPCTCALNIMYLNSYLSNYYLDFI